MLHGDDTGASSACGELSDPFPPVIEELARAYFERHAPEVMA